MNQTQNLVFNRLAIAIEKQEVWFGAAFAAYGAFFLVCVVMGGWIPSDWGKDVFLFPESAIRPLIPRSFISPFFFLTSLPALLAGAALLCDSCIRALRFGLTSQSQIAAVLMVAFGFAYVVAGAWPLQPVTDMLWDWQSQTMSYGAGFAWLLTGLSVVVLAVGCVTLWAHSKAYRRGSFEGF
jgi:hypothetical protein